jgi:hypothetical protein
MCLHRSQKMYQCKVAASDTPEKQENHDNEKH